MSEWPAFFSESLFWFSVLMLFYFTAVLWRRGSNDHFSFTIFLCIAYFLPWELSADANNNNNNISLQQQATHKMYKIQLQNTKYEVIHTSIYRNGFSLCSKIRCLVFRKIISSKQTEDRSRDIFGAYSIRSRGRWKYGTGKAEPKMHGWKIRYRKMLDQTK